MPFYPVDDSSIGGRLWKPGFKPTPAPDTRSRVVELGAERVGGKRDQSNCGNVEIASVGQERSGNEERLAFDNHTGEQQQVTIFEEKQLHYTTVDAGFLGVLVTICRE